MMRSPWLPRFRYGEWSSETIDGQGLEGRYLQFDWLGCTVEISFCSVAWHERQMARWARERERSESTQKERAVGQES